jgi:uncharacterized membrane protein (UPF0182 family)
LIIVVECESKPDRIFGKDRQLPALKRVIAAYGDRVVIKETLAEALSALLESGTAPVVPAVPSASTGTPFTGPAADRGQEQRVPILRRNGLVERGPGGSVQSVTKISEIEIVLQQRSYG